MAHRILGAIVILGFANSVAAEEGPHPWHEYGIGTYVKTMKIIPNSTRKPAIYTYVLKEKHKDGSVTIQYTLTDERNGEYVDVIDREQDFYQQADYDRKRSWRELTEREEIETPVGTLNCLVRKGIDVKGSDTGHRHYYSEKVPGEFVMSGYFDENGKLTNGLQVIEFELKK